MFTGHNSKFWDDRYNKPGYAYGTAPNQFLLEQKHRFQAGMKTLVAGDGEGRNGVWLATQGLEVLSIDLSSIGLQKAHSLALKHQVKIQTLCADLTNWHWEENTYDLVISIYLHFSSQVRQKIHQAMLKSLKPGGLLILEGFNQQQLQYQQKYNSGGPKIPEMLYTAEMLIEDFVDGNILELTETIVELHEGQYHQGQASVIRLVLQKFFSN